MTYHWDVGGVEYNTKEARLVLIADTVTTSTKDIDVARRKARTKHKRASELSVRCKDCGPMRGKGSRAW